VVLGALKGVSERGGETCRSILYYFGPGRFAGKESRTGSGSARNGVYRVTYIYYFRPW
jgi:hypothetical protein